MSLCQSSTTPSSASQGKTGQAQETLATLPLHQQQLPGILLNEHLYLQCFTHQLQPQWGRKQRTCCTQKATSLKPSWEAKNACKETTGRERAVCKSLLLLVSLSHHFKISLFKALIILINILINMAFSLKALSSSLGTHYIVKE